MHVVLLFHVVMGNSEIPTPSSSGWRSTVELHHHKKSPDFLNQGFCNFFLFRVYTKSISHSPGIFGLPCTSALIELKQYPTSNVLLRSFCQVAVCVNICAMINFTFINMRNYATFVGIEPTLTFNVKIKA